MVKYIAEGAGDPDNVEYGEFGANSRELLLMGQPMMLAWAWRGFFQETLYEYLNQATPWATFGYRLIFAFGMTLFLAALTVKLAEMVQATREAALAVEEKEVREAEEAKEALEKVEKALELARTTNNAEEIQVLEREHEALHAAWVKEQEEADEAKYRDTYATVALSLLSAAFGAFIAWIWNSCSNALGLAVGGPGKGGAGATAVVTTLWACGVTWFATVITAEIGQKLKAFAESAAENSTKPIFLKFVDLIMVALGYVVGWSWSDAVQNILMEYFAMTNMKALYLAYSVGVTVASIIFSYNMAQTLDDPNTPRLVRQYMTLQLNALALMTGWAWKAYVKSLVAFFEIENAGAIVSAYFSACIMSAIACYGYHKICKAVKRELDAAAAQVEQQGKGPQFI